MVVEDMVVDDLADRCAGGTAGRPANQGAEQAPGNGAHDNADGASDGAQGATDGRASGGAGVAAGGPGDCADEAPGLAAMVLGGRAVRAAVGAGDLHSGSPSKGHRNRLRGQADMRGNST